MTAKTSRVGALGGAALVAMGVVVGVQACAVETPVGPPLPANGVREVEIPAPTAQAPTEVTVEETVPSFTPFTQAPRLLNRDEIVRAIDEQYPPLLRDAGVGGTARVYLYINTDGVVEEMRLDKGSGHPALDDAALRVARGYRFEPARNDEGPVAVWVSFPITFGTPTVATREIPAEEVERAARRTPEELAAEPAFTPFTVAPSILNRREVVEAMAREYPTELREAGVGGTVRVYFFIDAEGRVAGTRIDRSSGSDALDEAALRVAGVYRFSPALNRDEKVPVWVSFPITFQSR